MTVGNESGVILTLDESNAGTLRIDTHQGTAAIDIDEIGLEPRVWEFGGLRKRIELYRLPGGSASRQFAFSVSLTELREGDNPIYIHMTQEDGQMAWSSPIYLAKQQ